MIVPISKGASQAPAPMGEVPSETNMLMALGIMHQHGYFDKDDKKSSSSSLKLPLPGGEK